MGSSILLVFHVLVGYALANPAVTSLRGGIGYLQGVVGGEWKKNKRATVMRRNDTHHGLIVHPPSDDDIVSWLQIESRSFPLGLQARIAQTKITKFLTGQPFSLSLVNRIQKTFETSTNASLTRMLNSLFPQYLQSFIELSPCAYERILSLSNYKKNNIGIISVVVDYLRTAPKNDICSTKLRKRLKEFFRTHYKTSINKRDISVKSKDEILAMPTSDILTILKSPSLFALYLPDDVQDYASHIFLNGTNDEIFEVMSLNLPSHEVVMSGDISFLFSYLQASERTFGLYYGSVPPFEEDSDVAKYDKDNKYGTKLIALRNHNWGLLDAQFFVHTQATHLDHILEANERWKRLFYQRKTEKKDGKVTFLTLEEDYNSISMGTATPELTEAFCTNATTLPDQTAQFWNNKFRRNIKIEDALLGVCPNDVQEMKKAIYNLRLAAHYNVKPNCLSVPLIERLPEFSWFVSLRELDPSVFRSLFQCGFTLEALLKMDKYIFILGELHENLAIAVRQHFHLAEVEELIGSLHPSIINFLKQNEV